MFKVWILNSKGLKFFLAADFTLHSSTALRDQSGSCTPFCKVLQTDQSSSRVPPAPLDHCTAAQPHAELWESQQGSTQTKNNAVKIKILPIFTKFTVLPGEQPCQEWQECLWKQKCCQTCSCGLNRQGRENRKGAGDQTPQLGTPSS